MITHFMAGYLGKTAWDTPKLTLGPGFGPTPTHNSSRSFQIGIPIPEDTTPVNEEVDIKHKPLHSLDQHSHPHPPEKTEKRNTDLPGMLLGGAGKGAVIGAGGSAILDWARNKPANVRRMVIMAFLGGAGGALYSAIDGPRGIWDPRHGSKMLERFKWVGSDDT